MLSTWRETQPKSKRAFSVSAPRALSTPARRAHIPSQRTPKPPWEFAGTWRTDPEAKRSGGLKGLQEVVPKEPPGHVRDTHLFTLSRPRRAAVPCKFGIGPPRPWSPPTPRRPVCGLRFRGAGPRSRVGAAAAAAKTDRPVRGSPHSRSPGRAAEGLRQDASSARPGPPLRRQDAAVRRVGAPYWGQRPVPPATPPPRPERGDASVPRAPAARGCLPFPLLGPWLLGSR